MKAKDLIKILQENPELNVMVRENNMETVSEVQSVSVEEDVRDMMSGDTYGTCVVIDTV